MKTLEMFGTAKKSQKTKKNGRKGPLLNLVLLLSVLSVLLIILEIGLRIVSYPIYGFQAGVFTSDDVIGYKLSSQYSGMQSVYGRNYMLDTNRNGMRDFRDYEYEKKDGVFRIVILGDSFAFGNGVSLEESYAEQLRGLFRNESIEILNFGVTGYGINNEYLSFISEGTKYDPDIVLVAYVTNDWNTHQLLIDEFGNEKIDPAHTLPVNEKGLLTHKAGKLNVRVIHKSLTRYSRAYSFIYSKSRRAFSPLVRASMSVPSYFLDSNSLEYAEAYDGYSNLLKKLDENTDAEVVVFIGPYKQNLVSAREVKKQYDLNYEVDPDQTQRDVVSICESLGIKVVNVVSNDESIFLPVDGHWNKKGNHLMAMELYQALNPIYVQNKQ